ncbi:hypothetical protein CLV47_10643 [Antricoccus suffuscus]|uniref:Uncharacterized protein n=1 Tax=Antricoccus suffuscus TaxID=1629062 RepID=A0A2T1A0P3_9ACTN|nr:hypothetical protein [Antricoccus suffuscus]PRZ42172.1 hypothetical protein CLV47_10643 [Antricoccus suffuscus]
MDAQARGQSRVDRIVLTFTTLLVLTMIGMFANNAALIMLPIPLIIAVMMLLATLGPNNTWPTRSVIVVLGAYSAISLAVWLVAWLALGNPAITIAGLPTSMGVLVLVGWPFYSIASGLLYAFCADRSGPSGGRRSSVPPN